MYPKITRKSTKNASGQLSFFALFDWLNIASLAQNLQTWHLFMVLWKFVLFMKLFTISTTWHSHDAQCHHETDPYFLQKFPKQYDGLFDYQRVL